MKKVTFALLLKEKQPEVFQVSQGSKIVTPVAEPESEITIPEGTFEEPVELKVEVVIFTFDVYRITIQKQQSSHFNIVGDHCLCRSSVDRVVAS